MRCPATPVRLQEELQQGKKKQQSEKNKDPAVGLQRNVHRLTGPTVPTNPTLAYSKISRPLTGKYPRILVSRTQSLGISDSLHQRFKSQTWRV